MNHIKKRRKKTQVVVINFYIHSIIISRLYTNKSFYNKDSHHLSFCNNNYYHDLITIIVII